MKITNEHSLTIINEAPPGRKVVPRITNPKIERPIFGGGGWQRPIFESQFEIF